MIFVYCAAADAAACSSRTMPFVSSCLCVSLNICDEQQNSSVSITKAVRSSSSLHLPVVRWEAFISYNLVIWPQYQWCCWCGGAVDPYRLPVQSFLPLCIRTHAWACCILLAAAVGVTRAMCNAAYMPFIATPYSTCSSTPAKATRRHIEICSIRYIYICIYVMYRPYAQHTCVTFVKD